MSNLAIGQSWRNNEGNMVTIVGQRADGRMIVRYQFGRSDTYSVDRQGGGELAAFDLVERVTRVYIAGPMTGLPDLNFPAFHAAAAEYRKLGCFVTNPAEVNPDKDKPWADCMKSDIPELLACEMIVMLDGWQRSKGARLEHHIARELGLIVSYPNQ